MTGKVNAVISGQAGVALLIRSGELASLHAGRGMEVIRRRPSEARFLLGDAMDLQTLEGVALDEVSQRLELATTQMDALHVVLILLDGSLSTDTRQEAASELQELIENEAVSTFVESVLFANPLPADADLPGAFTACSSDMEQTRGFLQKLTSLQEQIAEVYLAWKRIPPPVFETDENRRKARSAAVREGLFRELVLIRVSHAPVNQFLVNALLRSKMPHRREILFAWLAPLRETHPLPRPDYPDSQQEDHFGPEATEDLHPAWGGREAFERVERQKAAIVAEMERGRFDRVTKYVSDLLVFQLGAGDPVFACKSLCDLAMKAKGLRLYQLQLDLTKWSVEFKPDDGWSWTQYADALLNNGQFSDALAAYDRAIAYESFVESRTGRAGVLKAQNRLVEALSAYEEVISEFPDNVVARNGRAEVLKAQNRLGEALSVYDEVIAEFPGDMVARRGRAEMLKAQNRLGEALSAYNEIIDEFPQDVVARTGRAEVLKAQNRLSEALLAYDEIISEFPRDMVARTGRAGVLKAQNRLDGALSAYDEVINEFSEDAVARNGRAAVLALMGIWDDALLSLPMAAPVTEGDWIGYHIRGMIYLRTGRTDEAIQIFQEGVEFDPHPASREYFRTALAMVQIQQQAFKQAEETLKAVAEPALEAPANVLRFHAMGAQGQVDRATEVWRQLQPVQERPGYHEVVAELYGRYIGRAGASRSDDWLLQSEIELLLAA